MNNQKTILVIEDELSLSTALSDKLSREGFFILDAKNGQDGLNSALKNHPDLILLDIVMPVMDGMTMLKKLREDPWGKTVKVIILTNLTDGERVEEAVTHHSYEYLVKSDWKIEDISEKIKKELKIE